MMSHAAPLNIAIVGGGIAGLGFALGLHKRGIDCDVFEAVTDIKGTDDQTRAHNDVRRWMSIPDNILAARLQPAVGLTRDRSVVIRAGVDRA